MRELHLFAGAGGGILGGMLLGHKPVCAVEIEPYCQDVLRARQRDGILPEFPIFGDIRAFDGTKWRGAVDIVCGGFPCQDISAAGKGAGITGKRSGLWSEMARVIGEVESQFVFIENSPLLRTRGLSTVLQDLAEMGYDARWGVLGAWHVGAPHKRDRMWILARRTEIFADTGCQQKGADKRIPTKSKEPEWEDTSEFCGELANTKREQNDSERRVGELGRDSLGRQSETSFRENWKTSPDRTNGQNHELAHTNTPGLEGDKCTGRVDTERREKSSRPATECRGLPGASWWHQDPAEVGNATSAGLEGAAREGLQERELRPAESGKAGTIQQRPTQPFVGRVAHGVAHRVDRLKSIGNGQVPAVAATAFRILSQGLK